MGLIDMLPLFTFPIVKNDASLHYPTIKYINPTL